VSFHCTKFLNAIWLVGHVVVMSGELRAEWRRHRSRFSRAWQQRMFGARRVIVLDRAADKAFRAGISDATPEAAIAAILLKDCHLIEAALATDRRIASLDDQARQHFGRAAAHVQPLRRVCWVNPTVADEKPLDWLRQGAPLDRYRLLGDR
jgi:hypothetical protein